MSARIEILAPSIWPGADPVAANRAVLDVVADPPSGVSGTPGLLVLPHRGPAAAPIGRTLAIAESMPASLEPHGWRLAGRPSTEQRRAHRLVESDAEQLALGLAGYDGVVQLPVLGPFSLAAATWLPVGERVIVDGVARRDLVDSLALGVGRHLEAVAAARELPVLLGEPASDPAGPREAAPRAQVLLQEPWLPQILAGSLPTFSGRRTLPALPAEVLAQGLRDLVAAWHPHEVILQIPGDVDAEVLDVVRLVRPGAVQLDATTLGRPAWEALAEIVEAGVGLRWRSVPVVGPGRERVEPREVALSILRPLRDVGLRPVDLPLAITSGLAEVSPVAAQATLALLTRSALALGDLTSERD
ncbi:MAG: hypothetical protein J0H73_07390 [Salana multivorans]|uniref:hypothetical protein n=1 Tax=Salana multivorans TaxID=120377 RepID=UPI00095F2743|nr:hypothetical protein [Salana multivorans]MBN8882122.1 hypothetical protein [Salana multivorans]OJX98226.1 MAG: hypothetical protein BGO96_03230 [Micrococcales bacterium 73-15]